MKRLLSILIVITIFTTKAQKQEKLTVFLLPTSHSWDSLNKNYDFDNVFSQVLAFKPELIFTEYASPTFEKKVTYYWDKASILKIQNNMEKTKTYVNVEADITLLQQKIKKSPDNITLRAELIHAYWYNFDRGNGNYQGYYLLKLLNQKKGTKQDTLIINKLFGNLDSLVVWRIIRGPRNEYSRICFPLAEKLNISYLDGMDSQLHDSLWSVYWEKSDTEFDMWKKSVCKDSLSKNCLDYLKIRTFYLKQRDSATAIFDTYNEFTIHKAFASEAYNKICYWGDFKSKDYYNLKDYPKKLFELKYQQWYLRNLDMCNTIVSEMKKQKKGRSFVIVGASHGGLMKEILKNKLGVDVVLIK
jgi:hypothetical protein